MTKVIVVILFIMTTLYVDVVVIRSRRDTPKQNVYENFSAESIAKYNGEQDNLPVLLALDGLVYDVSAGKDDFYGVGQSYHYLVAKDASSWLHIYGADLIKNKYPVVGVYVP